MHTEDDNDGGQTAEEFALKRKISSTAAAVYTGVPGLLAGFLLQNPISFAYTFADRVSQNTFAFQPAVLFSLWDGWYLRSADATWVYGWRRHSPVSFAAEFGSGSSDG